MIDRQGPARRAPTRSWSWTSPCSRASTGRLLALAAVVVVDAPTEVALERLVTQRGMPEDDAGARIGSPRPTGPAAAGGGRLGHRQLRRPCPPAVGGGPGVGRADRAPRPGRVHPRPPPRWSGWHGPATTRCRVRRDPQVLAPGCGVTPSRYHRRCARLRGRLAVPPRRRPARGHRRAGRGARARRPLPDPARHHRIGQDGHHRLDHRGRPAAHADHRAQQVPGRPAGRRAEGVLPPQPGGVLRLLLRLLPARGLRPLVGHLHREGLVHQRRDRPPAPRLHLVAAAPARHHRGGLGLLHLRAGLARRVPRPDRGPPAGRGARPAGPAPAPGRAAVLTQRRHPVPRPVPGPRRHRRDPRRLREPGRPHRVLRGHGRADPALRRADRRDRRRARGAGGLRQHPLRHGRRAHAPGRRQHRGRAAGAGWASSTGPASSSRPSASGCAPSTTSRCWPRPGCAAGSRTTAATSTAGPRARRPSPCSTSSPRTSWSSLDESHVAVPQLRGQYAGDRSRKETLVDHGFRLPSAMDNRPLRFEEFIERIGQVILLSATPGPWELEHSANVVEQVIRPTGLVDPEVDIRAHHRADRRPAGADRRHRGRPATGCW